MFDDLPSLDVLNGKKRSSYSVNEQVLGTCNEQERQPHTDTSGISGGTLSITAGINDEADNIKLPRKVKSVRFKEQKYDFPAKKLKHGDRTDDSESDRFSIAAISGATVQSTSKRKEKAKSVTGVISIYTPKVRRSKKDTDISKLSNNSAFGTGQTTQWF